MHHHERVFDSPIGGVGHVRNAGESIEGNIVAARDFEQSPFNLLAEVPSVREFLLERVYRAMGALQKFNDFVGTRFKLVILQRFRVCLIDHTALFNLSQPVAHRLRNRVAALGIVEHVFLQIRVALHHPDITQHFVQHACAAPGFAFAAQILKHVPGIFAEQSHDDFAI